MLAFDADGRVLHKGIHDSLLVALSVGDDGAFGLKLRSESGTFVSVVMNEVYDYNFSDICNESIVSDLFAWKIGDAPDAFDIPDSAWNILFSARYDPEDVIKIAEKRRKMHGELFLVLLSCSYAGSIAVICRELSVCSA